MDFPRFCQAADCDALAGSHPVQVARSPRWIPFWWSGSFRADRRFNSAGNRDALVVGLVYAFDHLALPALVRSQTIVRLANRWTDSALQDPPAWEHDRWNWNSLHMAGALVRYRPAYSPAQKIALIQAKGGGHRRCYNRRPRGSRRASVAGTGVPSGHFALDKLVAQAAVTAMALVWWQLVAYGFAEKSNLRGRQL